MQISNRRAVDMTAVSLWSGIPRFAFPVAAGSILQHLFNSVDVAVVGRFAGSAALSAVGANAATITLFVNLLVGMSIGPNVLAAQMIGKGDYDRVQDTVHTTAWLSLVFGFLLTVIGFAFSQTLLTMMGTPEEILPQALLYLRVYLAGIPFITATNFGAALLRSIGDTKRPLYTLLTAGLMNAVLNLILVIAFHLDVFGVALATVLSNVFSAAVITMLLLREKGILRLSPSRIRLDRTLAVRIISIGLPSGLQGMIFSFSNLFVQSAINSFGSAAIAGSSAALNFEYFTYDVACSFSQACTTFTGQNYGARDFKRCRSVFRISLLYGFLFTSALSLFFAWHAPFFAGLYTVDASIIAFAVRRMIVAGAFEGISALHECSAAALRAVGYSVLPTVLTVIWSVAFRILWILTIFAMQPTFDRLMIVYPVSWILTGVSIYIAYRIISKKVFSK